MNDLRENVVLIDDQIISDCRDKGLDLNNDWYLPLEEQLDSYLSSKYMKGINSTSGIEELQQLILNGNENEVLSRIVTKITLFIKKNQSERKFGLNEFQSLHNKIAKEDNSDHSYLRTMIALYYITKQIEGHSYVYGDLFYNLAQ